MNPNTSSAYAWLRQLPRSLTELDTIPLVGSVTPFPWESFSEALAHLFELDRVTLTPSNEQWREKNELYAGLSDDLIPLNLSVAGLAGSLCWVMSQQDVLNLSAKVLQTDSRELTGLGADLEESFYRFVGFKVVNALNTIDWERSLSIHILNRKELPAADSFTVDVDAVIADITVHGRLIISPQFLKSLKERFSQRSLERPEFKGPLAEKLEATLHLEIGHTRLKLNEWKNVKKGDFILLDDCSIRGKDQGLVTITYHGVPYYTASLKDGALKIIERPLQREVNTTMDREPEDEEFEDFEDDFEDFEEDEVSLGDDEKSFEDSEFSEIEQSTPSEAPTEQFEQEITHEEPVAAKLDQHQSTLAQPNEIPMHVVVEVGRVKMSVQKLMELQPGNILDLNISPETGVDLTVNGRCIAKGELLKVGDVLGVRILDIG